MRHSLLSKTLCMFCALLIALSSAISTPVFAAEEDVYRDYEVENNSNVRSGVETFPLNQWYLVSTNFSVHDYNYTPVKTVQGRYLKIKFSWMVGDYGMGGETITIRMYNPNTHSFITGSAVSSVDPGYLQTFEATFDLQYSGRKIQIFTDVSPSSTGSGTGRTANFYNFEVYTYN